MSSTQRPSRWPYIAIYSALSAVALYHMRLGHESTLTGTALEPLFAGSPKFAYPGRTDLVRQHYIGVPAVDAFLAMLVTAFLAGPAGWKQIIQIQQANFLFQWTSVLVVWSLESVRGSKWSLLTFTSLWALFYQTVGGAVIVPLYLIAFTFSRSTGGIPANKARSLIPAVVLGYLVPTALLFVPYGNLDWVMLATAFWQPSPVFVNLLWAPLAALSSSRKGTGAGADSLPSRKTAYLLSGLISAIAHTITIYLCLSPLHPSVTLTSIFVPRPGTATAFDEAVHFVFQIDYLVIFLATTVWCVQEIAAVSKSTGGQGSAIAAIGAIVAVMPLLGPAGTLSAVWYWREGQLALGQAKSKRL